jgi:hypothetical protein
VGLGTATEVEPLLLPLPLKEGALVPLNDAALLALEALQAFVLLLLFSRLIPSH